MKTHGMGATARYAIPRPRPYEIPRPRLLDRLHAAIGNGLTLFQAPGGYGKSALAAQFVRDVEFEARWLSLDASCHAPETFAEQLVTAILRDDAWQSVSHDTEGALPAYVGAALQEYEESSSSPLLLVIDNAHELNGAEESAGLLAWLLQSLQIGSEVMLLTREPIPLPDLDRQLAGGDATLLSVTDLAFTLEEVAAVLEKSGHGELDAAGIFAATHGWPVAVRGIVSGTLSQQEAGRAAAGGAWDRYLAGEVWASVPETVRQPLMLAAVPPSVESSLITPLLSVDEWGALSRWMDEHDFFVEHIGESDRRLNPVVQRFLRDRFRIDNADAFAAAARSVINSLEHQERLVDALELSRSLHAHQELAALLQAHAWHLLQRGSFATLQRALDGLPAELIENNPRLLAIRARVLAHTSRPDDALAAADQVIAYPDAPIEAQHHARLARARSLRLLGRMSEVSPVLDVPLDDVPADRRLQAEYAWHRAQALLSVESDLDGTLEMLEQCIKAARETASPLLELLARSTLGQVLIMKGDGPAGVTELSAAVRGWRDHQGGVHTAWVLNNLGMAHVMVGDTESAISALTEARQESVTVDNKRAEAYAVASLGDAYLAAGDAARARDSYEEAIRMCADHMLDQALAALSTAGLAGALLELGDPGRADFVIRASIDMAEELGSPFELGICLLQQAAVSSACEQHREAVELAGRAVELLDSIGAEAALRTARYRLALVHFRDGDREASENVLADLSESITAPWMAKSLEPLLREHPLFAQWAAQREVTTPPLRRLVSEIDFFPPEPEEQPQARPGTHPRVMAQSLGALRVFLDGVEVADEAWESVRAKELFFLFLSRRDGIRKEEAFEQLYPNLPASRCNSQFHSNLYRIRKALFKESIVKRDGAYLLNPDCDFTWDVDEFQSLLDQASTLPSGSPERAAACEQALQLYRGPFAEAFFSEWAASLRATLERRSVEALASLGGYYAGRGEFEAAAACMEQVLQASRFNDEAATLLAIYRSRAGQPAAALAFIDDYREELHRELDEELPGRLQRLRHAIASGQAV